MRKFLKFKSLKNKIITVIICASIISTPLSIQLNEIIFHYWNSENEIIILAVNTIISLIITILIASFFIRWIVINPLKKLLRMTEQVANGHLDGKVEKFFNDEIGQLADSFQQMINSLKGMVKNIEETSAHIASSVQQLAQSADETTNVSEQISTAIQGVAAGSEEQTEGIEKITEAVTYVSNEINEISSNTEKMTELSETTTAHAKDGEEAVDRTVQQMNFIQEIVGKSNQSILKLNERSHEISQFLNVITDIAEQTNLLALNAAIEAARAGESGKGFAVVAEEVRKLAEESNQSAKQIGVLVNEIKNDTGNSVDLVKQVSTEVEKGIKTTHETKQTFGTIYRSMSDTNKQVQDIYNAAKKISSYASEVAATVEQVLAIAEENSKNSANVSSSAQEQLAAIEEITASSKSLTEISVNLQKSTEAFKL
ncbi:methyl-accepting chemotaxis protein [Bacillaceae bacterium Marseille-Q3522]|nr:methyl-accepting chemotaxis protein [Bacillaceae bacterium Marseille-Q3522]